MVAQLFPGGIIFFRNQRFGGIMINTTKFDNKILIEYMLLKSEMGIEGEVR